MVGSKSHDDEPERSQERLVRRGDWQVVFEIVRRLSTDERLGPDKIRCVVWYSI